MVQATTEQSITGDKAAEKSTTGCIS